MDSCEGIGSGVRCSSLPPVRKIHGIDERLQWYGVVFCCGMLLGMVGYGMVWYGMVWYGMVWHGMGYDRYGMVWHGIVMVMVTVLVIAMVRYGTVW